MQPRCNRALSMQGRVAPQIARQEPLDFAPLRASRNHIMKFFKGSPAGASEVAAPAAAHELFMLLSMRRSLSVCALIDCHAAINELFRDDEGHVVNKVATVA